MNYDSIVQINKESFWLGFSSGVVGFSLAIIFLRLLVVII